MYQLVINRFDLPKEILDHIKDFLFLLITEKTRRIKNIMCNHISESFWTPKNSLITESVFMFRIGKLHLFAPFCVRCGNYTWNARQKIRPLVCVCE